MEIIRNLGSDLISIMIIPFTILVTNDPHLGKSDTGQGARGTSSLWIGFECVHASEAAVRPGQRHNHLGLVGHRGTWHGCLGSGKRI